MAKTMTQIELTPEQQEEAQRLEAILLEAVQIDIQQMARLLASKKDQELFGQTEFQIRDAVHRIGAKALETAANERAKKGVLRC